MRITKDALYALPSTCVESDSDSFCCLRHLHLHVVIPLFTLEVSRVFTKQIRLLTVLAEVWDQSLGKSVRED